MREGFPSEPVRGCWILMNLGREGVCPGLPDHRGPAPAWPPRHVLTSTSTHPSPSPAHTPSCLPRHGSHGETRPPPQLWLTGTYTRCTASYVRQPSQLPYPCRPPSLHCLSTPPRSPRNHLPPQLFISRIPSPPHLPTELK